MEFVNKLFKYTYISYNQSTMVYRSEYALLHVPKDAPFTNNRSTLYNARHKDYYHEIEMDSIEDLTINF